MGPLDDAALLRSEAGTSLAFTVDFITPIVDDPEAFGAIAAANSLSDIYAMGGEPQAALAVCGFPADQLPSDVLCRIFLGGRNKAAEAGCAIVGGHTVNDAELKYGLCVIGTVDPARTLVQSGARVGDLLVLTKPLGFGIASQAIKKQRLGPDELALSIRLMSTLNKGAKDAALEAGAHAATDVTGFGLIGHLRNILLAIGAAARIRASAVPVLEFVPALAAEGLIPGGSKNNLRYVEPFSSWSPDLNDLDRTILTDAQTSGGLLITIAAERADALLRALERHGTPARAVIGEIVAGDAGWVEVV